jgi:hypothetical protein
MTIQSVLSIVEDRADNALELIMARLLEATCRCPRLDALAAYTGAKIKLHHYKKRDESGSFYWGKLHTMEGYAKLLRGYYYDTKCECGTCRGC